MKEDKRTRKRPLPAGKNCKLIVTMKDKRGGKIITKFATTLPKTYGYRVHIKR